MSWLIYTLLGVGIIILVICIVWLSKRSPVKEGLLDYFNIEDYLQAIPTTTGRFVRIRPSIKVCTDEASVGYLGCLGGMEGDGLLTIAQIQILDMYGNNIAQGKTVTASSTSSLSDDTNGTDSAQVTITVDGTLAPRINESDVWSSGWSSESKDRNNEYWQVDLGGVYQISQIIFSGIASNMTTTSAGEEIEDHFIRRRANGMRCEIFINMPGDTPNFTSIFPTSDTYQTLTFTNLINLTPIVTGGSVSLLNPTIMPINTNTPEVFIETGNFTTAQAITACGLLGSVLATPGQITNARQNGASWTQYGWATDGNAYSSSASSTGSIANATCFGIKIAPGVSSTVIAFASPTWSQYGSTSAPRYVSDTRITIPDIQAAYRYILAGAPDATNMVTHAIWKTSNNTYLQTPTTWWSGRPDLSGNGLYYALISSSPLNFLYENVLATSILNLPVFGSISSDAKNDMTKNLSFCSRIFLGSPDDVDKYINITHALTTTGMKASIRVVAGYTKFCRVELVQSVSQSTGNYVIEFVPANKTFNETNCNTTIDTTMLGLIPDPARNFIIDWIYNRTKRFVEFNDRNITVEATRATNLAAVNRMIYTHPFDVTSTYVLDNIAQSFYEAMGGNYTMTQIYDVCTIGGTILDVRFDLTKHADISNLKAQVITLKNTYYAIRGSNVSQDILDSAKQNYEAGLATLQANESTNVLPPINGVVGRFFYTYSTATAKITITGFTLDARAVTSFIPELNCGIQVATGDAAGALNYTPNTVYTKNVPETLGCTDTTVLRRIMDDYVDATQADFADILLGKLNSDETTYTGPAGAPSMDTTIGTVHINKISSAVQVTPTQCAIKWTETLWSDLSNQPVSAAVTNVTRRALFSYVVNTTDWYASEIAMDMSGFQFYPDDNVPACVFNPTKYQQLVTPRLDSLNPTVAADISTLKQDFITNTWNNGLGNPCPDTIPNYIFSAANYCAAWGDLNSVFNPNGILDDAGAKSHYAITGIYEGRRTRLATPITALAPPIIIQQPIPANNTLDNGAGACTSTTSCEDLNVLYSIVDQYNLDPTQPGSILRVTRAFTSNPYQCDLEVDINYDVNVQNPSGITVKKGSFSYDSRGAVVQVSNLPSGLRQAETHAFKVAVNLTDCSYTLNSADGPGTGITIQDNTPLLYKPMEYATQVKETLGGAITSSMNQIKSDVDDAATTAASVLPTYRTQTIAAVGTIATLASGAKCNDTVVLNSILAYYKTQHLHTKQVNTVLSVGTLNSTTCDLTVQEDTLAPGTTTGTYRIASSTTSGLRFTMSPNPTAMSYILPATPVTNMAQTPSSAITITIPYNNPMKETFKNYGSPVQVSESTFPLNKESFGLDMARNRGGPGLDTMFEEPLRSSLQGNLAEAVEAKRTSSYKYLRFRPVRTRYPSNPTVDVGKFRFFLGSAEIDMTSAKVTNPMGSWVGDIGDVIGPGFRSGWSDVYKRAIVFAFPYAMLVDGFTWTTTNPDKGLGGDPVQWKLEGSQNGTYWTVLRDQTKHNYAVPQGRFQELPVFRF